MTFEKCANLFQVTIPGCVMNLATEGKAAPGRYDRDGNDVSEN
jgi:hypothetical protein